MLLASGWGLWRIRHARDLAVHALGAAFIVHAFFVLSVGVHEHHMMLAVPLLALAAALRPSLRPLFWTISLIVALNMNLFYGIGLGLGWSLPRGLLLVDLSVLLSLANIAALVWHGRRARARGSDDRALQTERRLERGAIPLRAGPRRLRKSTAGTRAASRSGSADVRTASYGRMNSCKIGAVERLRSARPRRSRIPAGSGYAYE